MATNFPPAVGMQGISAAIVYTAIDRISQMIGEAESAMVDAIDSEIGAALDSIPGRADAMDAHYSEPWYEVQGALEDATLGAPQESRIDNLPLFLDGVVGTFFSDYTGKLDYLFPGLGLAGADAQAFVSAALQSAVGVSYNELVDSTPGETAFLLAQRQARLQERDALEAAAQAGHRFAHGHMLEALARARGASVQGATDALTQAYARRLGQEREEKMRLARAAMDTSMDRIKRLHQQVADALRQQLAARGMWVNDQNAVVDAANNIYQVSEQFKNRVAALMRETATRRFNLDFNEKATADRADFLGKIKMANANEVVDLFGNMVTTLMNQVSARGGYSGTERDVTDWDSILA